MKNRPSPGTLHIVKKTFVTVMRYSEIQAIEILK